MSALFRKEVRLLLPSFAIGLLLSVLIWVLPRPLESHTSSTGFWAVVGLFPYVCCPALAIMMALDSFGREVSSGIFSSLLAQPVPRGRIWWTKTVLLAIAMGILLSAWLLANFNHPLLGNNRPLFTTAQELRDLTTASALFALVAFSGALWTVLLFRQVAAAFWFTVLTPIALMLAVGNVVDRYGYSERDIQAAIIVTLIVYSVVGFLFAWRMFLNAQDIPWKGRTFTFTVPTVRRYPELLSGRGILRKHRPRLALLLKEIQLHHSLLLLAGVLAVVHLGVLLAREIGGGFQNYPTLNVTADLFWTLWLVLPLLVGCAAVAEERKVGTLEGQLCLPARRRTQFIFKFGVALLLCVFFGAVMPVLIQRNGILPDLHGSLDVDNVKLVTDPDSIGVNLVPRSVFGLTIAYLFLAFMSVLSHLIPFLFLATISVAVGGLSFYASSLARSTLQALAPAVLSLLVTYFVLGMAYQPEIIFGHRLWYGVLVYVIGVPLMIVVLTGLMYRNYKHVLADGRLWQRNLLALGVALGLVIAFTTAAYHRVWEFVERLEPPHGAARLTAQGTTVQSDYNRLIVRLPDGRIRVSYLTATLPNLSSILMLDPKTIELRSKFLEGTNWISLTTSPQWELAGIQTDGSLWISDPYALWRPFRSQVPIKLRKFGDEHDWKAVAPGFGTGVLLLKTDGTLWRLGPEGDFRKWPGLRSFQPARLGTNADWAEIYTASGRMVFRQNNGQIWLNPPESLDQPSMALGEKFTIHRAPLLEQFHWRSFAWGMSANLGFFAGIREDGRLQVQDHRYPLSTFRVGSDTNWSALSGNFEAVSGLKVDGSLWKLEFLDDLMFDPNTAATVRLGKQTDWIAVTPDPMGGVVALAADGGLWCWRIQPRNPRYNQNSILLAPSRKPHLVANILEQNK